MLLVGAVNVGEYSRIGPTGADCGATAAHASSRRCLLPRRAWSRGAELLCSAVLRGWVAGGVCWRKRGVPLVSGLLVAHPSRLETRTKELNM